MKKVIFIVFCSLIFNFVKAQCTAPSFTADLSAVTDTTWILANTPRNGVCCGSPNCVTFTVKTNPGTELISFDVTSPSPSGSAYYQVNCGTPVSIGTPLCIIGLPSPFTITYCKPGGDHPNYIITAGTIVHASADISIQKTSCKDTLFVSNVQTSSIVWTSIYPGTQGQYNSYLSCTTACNSTIVTPGPSPPPYVDFQVSGNPNVPCGSFSKDTVRVYFVPNITATITPTNPVICASSGTNVTLTANASGGATPYNYSWNTGSNNQSITTAVAGTYTVIIGDKTKCPKITFTKTIATLPSATFTFTGGSYCKNSANPNPTLTGTGTLGSFSSSPAGLVFVSTSTGQINLASSAVGTYTVTNTVAASGGCPGASATSIVTINPFPTMTSASSATVCSGSAVNIPLASSSSATYTWIANDNTNINGESLTTQTTSVLNNTLSSSVSGSQIVNYTVTPTSTLAGSCIGTSQTISVTVNQMDNAGFSYPASTFCQTGSYPTPTITGLSGGIFSGSAGTIFISSSTGEINLTASTVGTHTVTYTTNGVCPNTQTFTVTVTTAPTATFSFTASPYCQSAANPLPVFASGASGGVFTSTAGLVFVNSATGQVDLSASTPGTYTVTNTIPVAAGCASSVATATIMITPLKVGTFNYTGSPYCKNAANPSPTFTGGGVAGTFTSQAGLSINPSTGAVNLAASIAGTYTVTNTIASVNGCPAIVETATITITALPVATFNYPASPFCQTAGNPLPTFTGGGVAGVFNGSSVFVDVNSGTGLITLSNSTAGTYIITNTIGAANGCPVVTATASVTITSLPIGAFNYTGSPYCQNGTNPTPTLNFGGSNGIYTSTPAGLSLDANAGTVNLAASTPGTYTVTNTIAAAGGCPAIIETATIAITALPIGTFNYAATPYCQNGVDPTPVFTGGGVAGTFTSTAGLNINSATGTVNLSLSTVGTYTVTNTIAAANGCPAVVQNHTIAINPVATASAGSPATICSGTPYILSGAVGGGASSLTWTSNGTGSFTSPSSSTATYTPSGADITAGTVTLTITSNDPVGPCAAVNDAMVLTINPNPTVNAGANATICANTTHALTGVIGGGTTSFTWTTSGSGTFNNSNITNPVYTPSASDLTAGTVTLTITSNDPVGPCSAATANMILTITPRDNPNFNYVSSTFCQTGVNPTPTITGFPGGTFAGSPSLVINSSTGIINLGASPLGTFTVSYTTAGACPSASTVSVTITNAPSAAFSYTATPYCSSGTNPTPVFAPGSSGGTFSSGAGLVINSVGGVINLSASTPGTYTVLNTIAAAGGCAISTATTAVTIDLAATVDANSNQTICYGSTVTLGGSIGGSASSGTWTGGAGSYSPDPNTLGGTYVPTSADSLAGTVTLTLTTNDPSGVCPAVDDQVTIKINEPAIAIANTDQTICYGTSVVLAGSIGGSASSGTWTGGTGSFSPDSITMNATYVPTAADSTAGSVTLTLTSDDPSGVCPAVNNQMIITINQPAIALANADQIICYGNTVTLGGSVGGSAVSGTWTGGAGSYSPDPNTLGGTYVPTSADSLAGTITLTLTTNDPAGICPAVNDQMTIIINQPAVALANSDQTICYGSSVVLAGGIGGSASGATWSGGTGTFNPDSITMNATYVPALADSTAGTVTLTLTSDDPAGVCLSVNDQMVITINQPAIAEADVNQTICYGTPVVLAGTVSGSASSGTWSGGTGAFTPDAITLGATYIPSPADSAAQVVILTLTTNDPAGICPAVTDQMVISINQPALVFANADQLICYGNTVTLGGSLGGSATGGTWTGGTGTFSPDSITLNAAYIPTSADSAAGTITLTLTSDDPASVCPAVNDQMTITINQPAVALANVNQTVCYGTSVVLTGSIGGSASSGTWLGGNGAFSPDSITLNATYVPTSADSAAGVVTLTLTTNDPTGVCPAVNDTMTITINQPAVADAGADHIICFGGTVVLAGSVGGSATGSTWIGGAGSYLPNANTPGASYTPSVVDSLAGVITLTLTTNDPTGVCPAVVDTVKITMNQGAVALANSDQTICYGSTVTLAGAIGGSASGGTWSGGTGSYTPDATTLGASYAPTSADSIAGSVTLTLTTDDPTGSCVAVSDQMTIFINQPATTNANTDQTICYGSPVTLAGSIGGSALGGTWSGGSGIFSPNATTLGASYTPTSADSAAGGVTLTLTSNDPPGVCPAGTDQITITINLLATSNASADQTICYGSSVSLAGIVGGSATSGTWSGGTGSYTPNATTLGASYTPTSVDSAAGTVVLILTTNDPAGVCPSVTDQMTVTINQPALTNANSDQVICYGTPVILAGSIGGSATSGTWTTGGTGTFSPDATTLGASYTPSSADSAAGSITLTLTTNDPAGVCSSVTDQMVITITPPDNASFSYSSSVICQIAVNPVPVITGLAGGTFTTSSSSLQINSSTGVINATGSAPGTYSVTYTTSGVCPKSQTATVSINALPSVTAGADSILTCGANTAVLDGSGSSAGAGVTYQWNTTGGTILSGGTTTTPVVSSTGWYYLTVTDSKGCTATDSTLVTQGTINAAFTASPTSGTAPLNVTFTNGTLGASTYTWTLGNGNSSLVVNPSTTYTVGGTYTVTMIAQSGICLDTAYATIVVTDNISIIIPNVFTPNDDNINDVFFITTTGVTELHGDIFNRWGEMIYVMEGLQSAWDGKNLANKMSTDGTYYLILKAKGFDGKIYEKQAWITLIR